MTNQNGISQVLNVYNNADKVFNLHRDLPIVAMTCGMGHIGGRSISNLAKAFRHDLTDGVGGFDSENYTIENVVTAAQGFLTDCYAASKPQPVAGDYLEF